MNRRLTLLVLSMVLFAALGFGVLHVLAQQPGNSSQGAQATPAADPHSGATKFPLAARASSTRRPGSTVTRSIRRRMQRSGTL
jgi:hypothetical protein